MTLISFSSCWIVVSFSDLHTHFFQKLLENFFTFGVTGRAHVRNGRRQGPTLESPSHCRVPHLWVHVNICGCSEGVLGLPLLIVVPFQNSIHEPSSSLREHCPFFTTVYFIPILPHFINNLQSKQITKFPVEF